MIHHLEKIPAAGETLDWRGFTFEIVDVDGARIDKVLVTQHNEVNQEED